MLDTLALGVCPPERMANLVLVKVRVLMAMETCSGFAGLKIQVGLPQDVEDLRC